MKDEFSHFVTFDQRDPVIQLHSFVYRISVMGKPDEKTLQATKERMRGVADELTLEHFALDNDSWLPSHK